MKKIFAASLLGLFSISAADAAMPQVTAPAWAATLDINVTQQGCRIKNQPNGQFRVQSLTRHDGNGFTSWSQTYACTVIDENDNACTWNTGNKLLGCRNLRP